MKNTSEYEFCRIRDAARQQAFDELRDVFNRPTFKTDTAHDKQIVLDVIEWLRLEEPMLGG